MPLSIKGTDTYIDIYEMSPSSTLQIGLTGAVLNTGTFASWTPVGETSSLLLADLLKAETIYLATLSTVSGSDKLSANLY